MAQVPFPITSFQFPDTEPVANGWIILHLNKDCQLPNNLGQIAGRAKVRVLLDANGQVSDAFTFWPNEELFPPDSSYVMYVYNKAGELVLGPINLVIGELGNANGFGLQFGSFFGS